MPRPKPRLPKVPYKEEIRRMIALITEEKHRWLLMLLYGVGMRLSEVIALKPQNVGTRRMIIHFVAAKDKKTAM